MATVTGALRDSMDDTTREDAAKAALADIRFLLQKSPGASESSGLDETYLDGPKIVELLERNFKRLDPNNDGISRQELMTALSCPANFSADEYEMLRLVTKYFDTIINMADDQEGEELRISLLDMTVLKQFLVHGQMTLKELKRWSMSVEQEVGPPPLSDS
jgi:hypothetical protein